MNTPPKLPRSGRPSRAFLVTLAIVLTVGIPLAAWRMTKNRQELARIRRAAVEMAIRNNPRQIAASADHYFLENRTKTVTLNQLVGPRKYISKLISVDGEDYSTLDLTAGASWKIVSPNGVSVVYQR